METYIKLEWKTYPRIRIIKIRNNYISLSFFRECVHIHIGYTTEWHNYIRKTSLQIRPNLENILKIPCKISNAKRLIKPKERSVIEDRIRGFL